MENTKEISIALYSSLRAYNIKIYIKFLFRYNLIRFDPSFADASLSNLSLLHCQATAGNMLKKVWQVQDKCIKGVSYGHDKCVMPCNRRPDSQWEEIVDKQF